jgi:iron complex transport system ATP-binding protein
MMIAVQSERLTIGYRHRAQKVIAADLRLSLSDGELVCLVGPNGAGKTTLIRTLAGMQKPLSGRVMLRGQDISQLTPMALARMLSVVLTDRIDPGMLTAREVVALGRHPHTGWDARLSDRDHAAVEDAIATVDAAGLADRPFRDLSDGERQKIMIARALAQSPTLLILDEPTAFLDLPRRVEVMRVLRRLASERQVAVLVSTHDLDLALRSADRLWLIHPGGTVSVGAPEDLVLDGSIADAFRSAGAMFDVESATFLLMPPGSEAIVMLRGSDPLRLLWTRRALERAGFQVTDKDGNASFVVTVAQDDWSAADSEHAYQCNSLYDLLRILRSMTLNAPSHR